MDNEIGWRAKIGVIVPSPNWVVETWFNRVAPEGVSFHTAREMMTGKVSAEGLEAMMQEADKAIRELATAKLDAVAYCCTAATILKGPAFDKELMERLSSLADGIPVVTATGSLLKAFAALGIKKISIAHPYSKAFDELEFGFFEACSYKVISSQGMGITDPIELARPAPEEIYEFAKQCWDPSADALVINCLNFRAQAVIRILEKEIRKPVITSSQATLWNVLRSAGVEERIPGYGRLLEEF